MTANSFGARDRLQVGNTSYEVFRLDRVDGSARLPYSLKVLLENLLRNQDGTLVTGAQVAALASWDPTAESSAEIQFTRPGCSCKTSRGCRAWSTWSRCATRWLPSTGTRRRSTR